MSKIIFFVPHLDDELLVGGGLLVACALDKRWDVKVVFATNGDYFKDEAETRLSEAIDSCKVLGVEEENVIFLGYGDQWGEKHLYNCSDLCKSNAGRTKTYALESHPEYSYQKWGIHNDYKRSNYKNDIKSIILDNMPEVLVCVDYDSHPDHRALSLLFSEALKDVLLEKKFYYPLILKKLAYENNMLGKKDYYMQPHRRTQSVENNQYSTPVLKWNDRISFSVPEETNTLLLRKNIIYRAACCHKTQDIQYYMQSAINADIVYWRTISENYALSANISSSSGVCKYINDLKTIDSSDINIEKSKFDKSIWIPSKEDKVKQLVLQWDRPITINKLNIYENPNEGASIYSLEIECNKKIFIVNNLKHDGSSTEIELGKEIETDTLKIRILDCSHSAGITEIEVLGYITPIEYYNLPCNILKNSENNNKRIQFNVYVVAEKICMEIKAALYKYFGNRYSILREYPNSKNKKLLIIERIGYFFKRL